MIDYGFFSRRHFEIADLGAVDSYDILISAYNESERVAMVFQSIPATRRAWLLHPEYGIDPATLPSADEVLLLPGDEIESLKLALVELGVSRETHLALDITGMMRPHVATILLLLEQAGCTAADVFYAEPASYTSQENTQFSVGSIAEVRPILGYEGIHEADSGSDLLVLGPGFDLAATMRAAEQKRSARKVMLLGLPSLRTDMYQQNVLAVKLAEGSLEPLEGAPRYAPANDPFATASVLAETVKLSARRLPFSNLYLCALATKPQVLGFALYWLLERRGTATSLLHAFSARYSEKTSVGCARVWRYRIEFGGFTTSASVDATGLTS